MRNDSFSKIKSLISYGAFLILLLLPTRSSAQYEAILDTNKTWHASAFRFGFGERAEETYHLRDSVVIEGQSYVIGFTDTPGSSGTSFHGFFREDTIAGRLFFRAALTTYPDDDTIYSPEITTVDLGLELGQTYYQKYINGLFDDFEFAIDSVEHIVVDTGMLNDRAYVELEIINAGLVGGNCNPWNIYLGETSDPLTSLVINQRFIEGVGSSFGLFFLVYEDVVFHYPQEPYVLCMSKGESTVWVDPYSLDCQFVVLSDSELNSDDQNIEVYPNPSNGLFRIENLPSSVDYFSICRLDGKLLEQGIITHDARPLTINLNEFPEGLYLLNLRTGDGTLITKKLLLTK
jgi:hypothetical protein